MKRSDKVVWRFDAGHVFFQVLERVGKKFNWFVFDRGNSVAALILLTDLDKVILIRQYRAGVDSFEVELPAGMCEVNEDPAVAMVREMKEETGFAFKTVKHLFHLKLSPGAYTEESDIFFFKTETSLRVETGGGLVSEGEELEIMYVDVNEAIQMMKTGKIQDAKTVVALQWIENQRLNM